MVSYWIALWIYQGAIVTFRGINRAFNSTDYVLYQTLFLCKN